MVLDVQEEEERVFQELLGLRQVAVRHHLEALVLAVQGGVHGGQQQAQQGHQRLVRLVPATPGRTGWSRGAQTGKKFVY